MRKLLFVCLVLTAAVAIGGCGRMKLNAYLDDFNGKPVSAFIAHHGVPDSEIPLNPSGKLYEWHKDYSRGTVPGVAQTGQTNVTVNVASETGRGDRRLWCDFRATTDENDIIQDIVWQGNYCRPMN